MDIRKIKKLIELVEESGISELEISEGEESVRISRAPAAGSMPMMQPYYAAAPAQAAAPVAAAGSRLAGADPDPCDPSPEHAAHGEQAGCHGERQAADVRAA